MAPSSLRHPHKNGYTAVHVASMKGHVDAIGALHNKGADIEARDKVSSAMAMPTRWVHVCVVLGHGWGMVFGR